MQTDDGGNTLQTGSGGGGGSRLGCFGVGGGGETLQAGGSSDTELGQWSTGAADVQGTGVASACQGPLGRPSDGSAVTRSVGKVGVSGAGGKGVWVGDDGVGRISGLWAVDCDGELCRMSRICCLKAKGSQVRTSGWKPWK